ncbi:mannose-6-phosphate isomerase, class I [Leifsonia flava]|uniref:mannose-6-phosphate isomerase n=1 Tax=Orlajensenia leifsoniae TaxID=2561933 RepID=A0A4Y9QVI9_9MICO|nr:mannose-6-phosphate isomerase, class I [Leifsonia flava]TFV96489.1 mannose-6-phosphate isomerase, class I [Leifsonia flava]
MFVAISNTPRDYAWGSTTAIAGLLGTPASGAPEAELWLGAHSGSPSRIDDPAQAGGAGDLVEWIESDAATALGAGNVAERGARLPFLLKVLAAGGPLSLQAHPSPEQAQAGFARENAAGIPLEAPNRNYKDAFHKPELVVAVSPTFDALCGFRPLAESRDIVKELTVLGRADAPDPTIFDPFWERLSGPDPLRSAVEWLLRSGRESGAVDALVERVMQIAGSAPETSRFAVDYATVRSLAASYPGDPGIVLSLLLNHVTLRAGEALYLPAGNIHAYLSGLGIELMAASDNVLRGGLTPKYIDVEELLDVLDFTPVDEPLLAPETPSAGVHVFRPDVPDFVLYDVDASADTSASVPLSGAAIALCTAGTVTIAGAGSSVTIARGDAVYVTPDEGTLAVTGAGRLYLATVGE